MSLDLDRIDRLVAMEVMGCKWNDQQHFWFGTDFSADNFQPTRDGDDCGLVLNELVAWFENVRVWWSLAQDCWLAEVGPIADDKGSIGQGGTWMVAVCLAALRAKGVEESVIAKARGGNP